MNNLLLKLRSYKMNEVFVDVLGYQKLYQVTNQGRVFSVKRQKFLKFGKTKNNYFQVCLYKDGEKKYYYVHRLVASAFLKNPLHLSDVNHISEDKTDNRVENLEWMSHKENCNYGTAIKRRVEKQSKSVLQLTKQGELVNEYVSTIEASRQTKINQANISSCCLGKLKSAGKYLWKYKISLGLVIWLAPSLKKEMPFYNL